MVCSLVGVNVELAWISDSDWRGCHFNSYAMYSKIIFRIIIKVKTHCLDFISWTQYLKPVWSPLTSLLNKVFPSKDLLLTKCILFFLPRL